MRARLLVGLSFSLHLALIGGLVGCLLGGCRHHGPDSGADDLATGADQGTGGDLGPGVDLGPASALTFESGPVRPVALSADGTRVFVANIPDGYLEIFGVGTTTLTKQASVPVGMEPVSVAVRSPAEVWVVNQLSDSISIVDVAASPPRVTRTLLVGDEPSDLVFAGSRAFVTTAHRGQRRTDAALASVPGAGDPQLTTAGIGRADVWVFDATSLGADAGGVPIGIVTLPGDTPRALAVTPDGTKVYAAVFKSGNQSTVTAPLLACDGFDNDTPCTIAGNTVPGSPIGPGTNYAGIPAPRVGTLVKQTAGKWLDGKGRDWSGIVKFTLPDTDVFSIDAATLAPGASFAHVGTTLFNMTVNPANGHVYVSNTEARNDLRFEGPGTFAKTTLQGHLAESRITVLSGSTVTPHHLNKHIDYAVLPAPAGVADHSLATPVDLVTSADGATLYVAAFGSSKVGVLPTAALEADTFDPTTASASYLTVTGGGPGGLALDDTHHRLFVATRFDDGLSMFDLSSRTEVTHVRLHTPEAAKVVAGRPFLYDAKTGSNGEAACASCHMFGDMDQLAWDLGNPDGDVTVTPITIKLGVGAPGDINGTGMGTHLHPMKGPMSTQSFRGMVNHGPMHWRGDRVSGFFGTDTRTSPPYDSELAFKNFIQAFQALVGRGPMFDSDDMQTFADFALAITMPPNPIRAIDSSLTTAQASGRAYFMGCAGLDSLSGGPASCTGGMPAQGQGHFADGVKQPGFGFTCQGCHTLDSAQGFYGTNGEDSFEALPQINKIPQLRNLYTKVGMFGVAAVPGVTAGDNANKGAQVRGFGFENDGTTDTLFRFLQASVFDSQANGRIGFDGGNAQRRDVEQFLLAFDNDLAPVVGQQVTLLASDDGSGAARVATLVARAQTPFVSKILGGAVTECDLAVHGVVGAQPRAYLLRDGAFVPDGPEAPLTLTALAAQAKTAGQALTFTCMVPGWGPRALDRDLDGVANSVDSCPDDASCR